VSEFIGGEGREGRAPTVIGKYIKTKPSDVSSDKEANKAHPQATPEEFSMHFSILCVGRFVGPRSISRQSHHGPN
jgi:hypothetical protein